jgi:hypothetical protein
MRRIILRLSTALLAFAIGVAVTAIYRMNGPQTLGSLSGMAQDEVPIAEVALSCYPGRSIPIPAGGNLSYFPARVLSKNEWGDQSRANWYSRHLIAMKEAPLYSSDTGGLESYRFLWLRSFHQPVAVHLWKCGAEHCLTVKEMSGAGGYEPGTIILNRSRKLTATEWSVFQRRLELSCYWQLPSEEESSGFDGAQWILEGVKEDRYHVVDRWTPQHGSYFELCMYVLNLSGLTINTTDEPVY